MFDECSKWIKMVGAVCVALGALGGLGAALCRTRAPCRGHLWDLLLMRWESVNLVTSSTAPAAGIWSAVL